MLPAPSLNQLHEYLTDFEIGEVSVRYFEIREENLIKKRGNIKKLRNLD